MRAVPPKVKNSKSSSLKSNISTVEINRWFDLVPMPIEGIPRTEAEILDAARRCYVTYGVSKMSLSDVAQEAGVSRGSVYKYFSSRGELLRRVLQWGMDWQMDVIDRAMAQYDTFEDQYLCAVEQMRLSYLGRPPVSETSQSNLVARGLTSEAGPYLRALINLIERYVRTAKAKGEVRRDINPEEASEWLARMLLSLVAVRSQTFDFADAPSTVSFIRAFAVRGLD